MVKQKTKYALLMIFIAFSIITIVSPNVNFTGMVVLNETHIEEHQYRDKLDRHLEGSETILWSPEHEGNVSDIKVNGEIYGPGDVEVTLIKGGKEFLIYKRSLSQDDHSVEDYVDDSHGNNIGLKLSYGSGKWDEDNDGVVTSEGGVDLSIDPIFFSGYKESNLCTIWDVYSSGEYNSACYGSEDCCNYLGFSSTTDKWDEDFVLVKDKYGATKNNFVLARVVNYKGGSVDYSNYDGLSASFVDDKLNKKLKNDFETLYESENYFIKVSLEEDTFFYLKNIEYTTRSLETKRVEKNVTDESKDENETQNNETKEKPEKNQTNDVFKENKSYIYLKQNNVEKGYSIKPNKSLVKKIKFHDNKEDLVLNLSIINFNGSIKLIPAQDKDMNVTYKIKIDKEDFNKEIKAFNCKRNDLDVQNVLSTSEYKYVKVNTALCDLTLTSKEVKSLSEDVSPEKFAEPQSYDLILNPLTYFLAACIIALVVWIVGSRKN